MSDLTEVKLLLTDADANETIDVASRLGYGGVELAIDDDVIANQPEFADLISERCSRVGLSLAVHAPSMDLRLDSSNSGIRRESVRQICATISLFGHYADYVTFHTGYARRFAKQGSLERTVASLQTICAAAAEFAIPVAIENVYESSVDELLNYFDLLESPWLGLTFDFAHAHAYGKLSPPTALRVLGDKLTAIHLSDNFGKDDLHLALGRGDLPLAEFMNLSKTVAAGIGWTVESRNVLDAETSAAFLRSVL